MAHKSVWQFNRGQSLSQGIKMDLLERYSDIVKTYPEYVTQQQMSRILSRAE